MPVLPLINEWTKILFSLGGGEKENVAHYFERGGFFYREPEMLENLHNIHVMVVIVFSHGTT